MYYYWISIQSGSTTNIQESPHKETPITTFVKMQSNAQTTNITSPVSSCYDKGGSEHCKLMTSKCSTIDAIIECTKTCGYCTGMLKTRGKQLCYLAFFITESVCVSLSISFLNSNIKSIKMCVNLEVKDPF